MIVAEAVQTIDVVNGATAVAGALVTGFATIAFLARSVSAIFRAGRGQS